MSFADPELEPEADFFPVSFFDKPGGASYKKRN
jgi:hypothetical protein